MAMFCHIWQCVEQKKNSVFLNQEGRCFIHEIRPGFCRLFPLGRYYTEDGFKYIIQIHECAKKNRSKIKVKKWIDTPDLRQYEKFVWDWHQFLLDVQEVFYQTEDADLIKNLNMYVLSRFYTKSYEENRDFYEQFYERLEEDKKTSEPGSMSPGAQKFFLNEKLLIIFCKEFIKKLMNGLV